MDENDYRWPCITMPMTLDRLNDDCLAHLLQLLDIHDLYAIACTSSRFEDILPLLNCKFKYTVTNLSDPKMGHFLQLLGTQIKSLNVTVNEKTDNNTVLLFLDDVQTYCTNVKHLSIKNWRHLNFEKYEVLLKRLQTVRLQECKYQEKIEILNRRFVIKPWIMAPASFHSLSPSAAPKSDFLANLTNITSLKLYKCTCVRPEHLVEFLEQNPRLINLTLFGLNEFKGSGYDQQYFEGISKYLQAIESFSIDNVTTSNIQFLANLPNLRTLRLNDYYNTAHDDRIVDSLVRKLRERDAIEELELIHCDLDLQTCRNISLFSKLTTLKLCKNFHVTEAHLKLLEPMPKLRHFCCFDCMLMSDDALFKLVKMAPQLEQLDCSWCFQITDRMVLDVVNYLIQHKQRPKLQILAGGRTKITETILKVSEAFVIRWKHVRCALTTNEFYFDRRTSCPRTQIDYTSNSSRKCRSHSR